VNNFVKSEPLPPLKTRDALLSLLIGFKLCLTDSNIRKLAILPWLIGVVTFAALGYGALFYVQPWLLELTFDTPDSIIDFTLYYLSWLFITLFLLVAVLVSNLVLVMIFGAFFQSAIAERVLKGDDAAANNESGKSFWGEVFFSARTELVKLLWLLPLLLFCFVIAFFPFLAPVALALGAWVLAYESLDLSLEVKGLTAGERLKFGLRNSIPLLAYGLNLTVICLIPFVGMFIPPISTAGAAWLLKRAEEEASKQSMIEEN